MKKLMFMLGAIAMAVGVQAATVSWSYTSTYLRIGDTTNTKVTDGTLAYLITTAFTQDAAVSAFAANGSSADVLSAAGSALYTGTGVVGGSQAGKITGATSTGSSADVTAYFVVFYGGNMYLSSAVAATVDPLDATASSIAFTDAAAVSKALPKDATGGFSGAGWYAAAPEPTSGLLMLVGLGALALRRRRA